MKRLGMAHPHKILSKRRKRQWRKNKKQKPGEKQQVRDNRMSDKIKMQKHQKCIRDTLRPEATICINKCPLKHFKISILKSIEDI